MSFSQQQTLRPSGSGVRAERAAQSGLSAPGHLGKEWKAGKDVVAVPGRPQTPGAAGPPPAEGGRFPSRKRLRASRVRVLQPDLRLPRQGPQHLRRLLLLWLFLEHVLQRLQVRPQQDAAQVPPCRGQPQGGEQSSTEQRGPPTRPLPYCRPWSSGEGGLARLTQRCEEAPSFFFT